MKREIFLKPVPVDPIICELMEARLLQRISIDDLAPKIGASKQTLQRIERGVAYPGFKLLAAWAAALGFNVSLWPKSLDKPT